MKAIAISGASGLLATELIHMLLKADEYEVYAITGSIEKLRQRYSDEERVHPCTLDDFGKSFADRDFYSFVHCAFSRSSDSSAVASSLDFGTHFALLARAVKPVSFINISSQSVYGENENIPWTEDAVPSPNYLYAMGKYASEKITEGIFAGTGINATNIRLSSVSENTRFLSIFCKNALAGVPITVQGGKQVISFIDVRDAASGLAKVIEASRGIEFKPVYNLAFGEMRTIGELADDVKRLCMQHYEVDVVVDTVPSDIVQLVGMDNNLFKNEFSWEPRFGYDDMIESLLNLHKDCGGGVPVSFLLVYRKLFD